MRFALLGVILSCGATVIGCTRPKPTTVALKPPEVIVGTPNEESVADFEEFTGRTTAFKIVEIRARVTGHLEKLRFKDGDEVKINDPLFDIDPKPYQAELERAQAAVKQAKAKVDRLTRDDIRAKDLLPRKAISQEEADRISGELAEAIAGVDVSKAQEKLAQQNVDYTHIKSPINGRIGKRSIDEGNLVKADDTLLTTIVEIDKLYADFDVDDRTDIRLGQLTKSGEIASIRAGKTPVRIGLPNEEGYSKDGTITFVDNKLNSGTGTLGMRAEIDNADRLLAPGLFVRVRVPIGEPKPAVLIPESAIATDQGWKYVYVVNAEDKIEFRRVKVGMQIERIPMRKAGEPEPTREQFRVVEAVPSVPKSGLKPTERIVMEGLQRVRDGMVVSPKVRTPQAYQPLPSELTRRETPPPTKQTPTSPAGS